MALEIERRFLVQDASIFQGLPGAHLTQGYLFRDPERTVRVRLEQDSDGCECAWLTIKGRSRLEGRALVRAEWELVIEPELARKWLALCLPTLVKKTRHRLDAGARWWEIDRFHGDSEGLVIAEIEMESPDEALDLPPWLGREISDDPRYSNAALSRQAWRTWPANGG